MQVIDQESSVSLHHQIKKILQTKIVSKELKPGERIPSEFELCETYGVSRITVRQALSELYNHGLIYRRAGKGTFVASSTGRQRMIQNVGVGLYDLEYITFPFFSTIVSGIGQVIDDKDYHLYLSTTHKNSRTDKNYYSYVIDNNLVDGLIIIDQSISDKEILGLKDKGVPLVLMNRYIPGVPCVLLDNAKGIFILTEHLIELGHRRIGYVDVLHSVGHFEQREKLMGFKSALQKYELEDVVYLNKMPVESVEDLLRENEYPTALVFATDTAASAGINVLRAKGLSIPDDISVAVFADTLLLSNIEPAITSAHFPLAKIGNLCGEMLMRLIKGEEIESEKVVIEPKLNIQDSTVYNKEEKQT